MERRIFRADHPSRVIMTNDEWMELVDELDQYILYLRHEKYDEPKVLRIQEIVNNIYLQLATGAPAELPDCIPSTTEIPELE